MTPGAAAHRLTPKGKEKVRELRKMLEPLIEAENRQRDLAQDLNETSVSKVI